MPAETSTSWQLVELQGEAALSSEASPIWPTLTSCYRPVEQYLELLARCAAEPALRLLPLDVFLLRQLAGQRAAIIDLAADATQGASTAVWLAVGEQRVFAPRTGNQQADWRAHVPAIAETLGWPANAGELAAEFPPARVNPLTAPFVQWTAELTPSLADVLAWRADAVVALLGLGLTGQCAALKTALDFCQMRPAYRFTLLREVSPFFAASQLGLLAPVEQPELTLALERLRQQYAGNFQFLAMAEALTQHARAAVPLPATPPPQAQPHSAALAATPLTAASLRYETKRWLWQRVLPPSVKLALNRLRGRAVTPISK